MVKIPLHRRRFDESITAVMALSTDPEDIAKQMVADASAGIQLALDWLDPLIAFGLTTGLLQNAIERAGVLSVRVTPVITRNGRIGFEYDFPDQKQEVIAKLKSRGKSFDEALEFARQPHYALAFLRIVDAGLHKRIRLCDVCRKLYYGDPRAKFCSKRCGSLKRVRAKRARDRQ